jgi:formylglycine-generating enzyme required for sulfatase activity
VFEVLHVKVDPVFDGPGPSLAKLESAEVAAFAYVAAKPAPLFHGLSNGNSYGLHFLSVPLPMGKVPAYLPRQLTAADYPGLVGDDGPILTIGVNTVMVAANLLPGGERYRGVSDFVDVFFAQLPQLQKPPHHPKWKEVNPAAEFPGWKRFAPAAAWLGRQAAGGGAGDAAAGQKLAALVTSAAAKGLLPGDTVLEMVALPGGTFEMGSTDDPSEEPVHRVTIAPFSIARYPVTRRQWQQCVSARACAEIAGTGGDDAPMTNVSWDDAQSFVVWLQDVTKKRYRLPSEAEWEYAARAGTQTKYWWGNKVVRGMADCKGCGDPYDPRHVLKVANFPPNPFGLSDMAGTVAEWVADCRHKNYQGAPAVSSPWVGGDCRQHVLRGGSWQNDPSELRVSSRDFYDSGVRYGTHGFRPARSDEDTNAMSLVPRTGELR